MLIHPSEHLLVVRPCTKETKNAIQWANLNEGQLYSRTVSCAAYIKSIYNLFGLKQGFKYRMRGIYKHKDIESAVIFDIKETEIFMPQDSLGTDCEKPLAETILPNDV